MNVRSAILVLLICFSLISICVSQSRPDRDKLILSVSTERVVFRPGQKALVTAKLLSVGAQDQTLETLTLVDFSMERRRDYKDCYRADCFEASTPMNGKELKSGKAFELAVDLAELPWLDQISSAYVPESLFKKLPPGEYYLSVKLYVPSNDSTKKDLHLLELSSNRKLITVESPVRSH